MNDNFLTQLDVRTSENPEPLTPEGALVHHMVPLESLAEMSFPEQRKHTRLARLAREYLVDFDLVRACARAGLDWEKVKKAERDPLFITMVQDLVECMRPEDVVSRQEVLQMLKKEACTASKASDRISAINSLARLTGMELPTVDKQSSTPIINITLNGMAPASSPPVINVTPRPEALL